jgi:hypothetical protein
MFVMKRGLYGFIVPNRMFPSRGLEWEAEVVNAA